MEITLVRTGGIISILKKASINVDISNQEINELINLIKADETSEKARDATQYQLNYNGKSFNVDLDKIPPKYKETFENLKGNLKIIKQ